MITSWFAAIKKGLLCGLSLAIVKFRGYVRHQVPSMLAPESTASVLESAGVTATEAIAPQIVFEVTRVINSIRPLVSGGPAEWHEATQQLEAARARFGDQPVLLYWLGRFKWRLANRPAAIDFFQRAIDAGSTQADTYANLALVLM